MRAVKFSLAEQIMENRDLEILADFAAFLDKQAYLRDMHPEQIKAVIYGAMSEQEINYVLGQVQ